MVNGEPVVDRDLFEAFWSAEGAVKRRALHKGGRHFLLDQVINERLLLQEATRRGLEPTYDDSRRRNGPAVKRFLMEHFEKTVRPEQVTEEEMRAAYEERREEFARPETRRVHVLHFDDQDEAQGVLEEALATNSRVVHERLYKENKYHPLAGGIMSPAEAHKLLGERAARGLFALEPPEKVVVPALLPFRGGWMVLISPLHVPAQQPTYEQSRSRLRRSLYLERREDALHRFAQRFSKQSPVTIAEGNFDLIPWTAGTETAGTEQTESGPWGVGAGR
jgi:hypothetical protein